MKKTSKILAVVLAVMLVATAVVVLAACDDKTAGAAYGLVHRQGYVGKATVSTKDGAITKATLDEACFPDHVTAEAADGDYTVTKTVKESDVHYYKTVKWADVTATYDETDGYKVGEKTLKEYFADEANAKAYFEAVVANKVTVVTSAGEKKNILTAANLLKSKNGYWDGELIHEGQLGWKANVQATIDYVVAHGFDNATFTKTEGKWVDAAGVATGATWTDMADYINLLSLANTRSIFAATNTIAAELINTTQRSGHNYQVRLTITIQDGKITAVTLGELDAEYEWSSSNNYGNKEQLQTWVDEKIVGQTIETVKGWKVDLTQRGAGAIVEGPDSFHYTSDSGRDMGSTETCSRLIAAIQDALSKLPA